LKDWTKILVKPTDSLDTAIQTLQSGGKRIVLVVDDNNKLLGTVTDGDVRRALIKHISMDCAITKVMNEAPITALKSDKSDWIMKQIKNKDLLHIPIVDEQGILIELETLQHLLEKKKYDNPVFLMAGGIGARLRPLTYKRPKPLLNIGNRPILEVILNQFIDAGFHNFYISINYKAEMIREHFGDGSNWDVTIEYVHEENPLGTAGSLGLLPSDISKLPIIMMNGDILTKVNIEDLLYFHQQQNCLATMCIREYDFEVPYGVVNIEDQYIKGIIEKPVHKFFVNAGIYVLDTTLVNCVDGNTYLDMPNLLESQIKQGERVSIFPIHEYWMDIGRMEEYEKAHQLFVDSSG